MSSKNTPKHLYFGRGGQSAIHFGEVKTAHSLPEKEEKNSSRKIAYWGDDNLYPNDFMTTLKKNGAAGVSYRLMKATHYGQGFRLMKIDSTDDGKEDKRMVPLASQPEVKEFFNRVKMQRVWTDLITDLETWSLAFPEFILTNDFTKIYSVRRLQTSKMRYELINPKTGMIENAYYCHDWSSKPSLDSSYVQKIPVVDMYQTIDHIKEHCKKKKIHKFTMPIFYPLIDETYYPDPDHHSVYRNGWMDVVNAIPEYKKAYSKNQLNIKYMVYISEEYFMRTYGDDWRTFDTDKKNIIRKELADAIDEHLSGNDNAGKSLQVTTFKDREGKWIKGIEVVPLEVKNNGDGLGLLDAGTGNAEIMSAIGVDANLLGVGIPGGKMNTGSGSDKREAFQIMNALFKTKRETTLEVWRMIRDYNGFDSDLEGDFAATELTTLDKNPTGTQTVI